MADCPGEGDGWGWQQGGRGGGAGRTDHVRSVDEESKAKCVGSDPLRP